MTVRVSRICSVVLLLCAACSPRVTVVTGTTIGLKATPGNPDGGRPPQVTLGYKRAEVALVPTAEAQARRRNGTDVPRAPTTGQAPVVENSDAYSTLASVFFETTWFDRTEIASFISTGFAARALVAPDDQAADAAALGRVLPSDGHDETPRSRAPASATPAGSNSFMRALVGESP